VRGEGSDRLAGRDVEQTTRDALKADVPDVRYGWKAHIGLPFCEQAPFPGGTQGLGT